MSQTNEDFRVYATTRRKLTLRGRRRAWHLSKDCWAESGHDREKALQLVREKTEKLGFPAWLIEIFIMFAAKWIAEWLINRIVDPQLPVSLHDTDEDE